jgi:hypothetical protein
VLIINTFEHIKPHYSLLTTEKRNTYYAIPTLYLILDKNTEGVSPNYHEQIDIRNLLKSGFYFRRNQQSVAILIQQFNYFSTFACSQVTFNYQSYDVSCFQAQPPNCRRNNP